MTDEVEFKESELIRLAYAMAVEPWSHHLLAEAIDNEMADYYEHSEASTPEKKFQKIEVHFNNALSLLEKQGRKTGSALSSIKSIERDPNPVVLIRADATVLLSNAPGANSHGWVAGYRFNADDFSDQGIDRLLTHLNTLDSLETDKAACVLHVKELDEVSTRAYVLSKVISSGGELLARLTSVNLSWLEDFASQFQKSFKLTPIELRITQAIVTSQSLRDLAKERGRSLGTLRNQLKYLLAKLDLNSQTELACLYSGYVQLTKSDGTSEYEHNFRASPWRRQNTFIADDGFMIDYSEVGPMSGRPVLYFHPAILGTCVCDLVRQELIDRNIRLIMPWKPGFGMTSLTANAKNAPKDFAAYCVDLLSFLNVDRVQVIGVNTGIIPAMYLAAQWPSKVMGVVGLSPVMPLSKKSYFKAIAKPQRSLYYIARHAPQLMPLLVRSVVAKCDSGHDEEWVLNHFRESPLDLDLMADPKFKALARETFAISYMNGIEGVVRDFNFTGRKWQNVIEKVKCDITLLTGQQTKQFNSNILSDCTNNMLNAKVEVIEGAAYFVLHQKPNEVFDLIDQQVN